MNNTFHNICTLKKFIVSVLHQNKLILFNFCINCLKELFSKYILIGKANFQRKGKKDFPPAVYFPNDSKPPDLI